MAGVYVGKASSPRETGRGSCNFLSARTDILPEVRRATVDMLKDPIYDIEIRKKAAHNALQYPVNPTELISGYVAQVSS